MILAWKHFFGAIAWKQESDNKKSDKSIKELLCNNFGFEVSTWQKLV